MMNKPPYLLDPAHDFEAVGSLPDCARRRARPGPIARVLAPPRPNILLFAG